MANIRTTQNLESKRGVYYVRVSTEEQVNGTSLDDQERQCLINFESAGIELVRPFREEGASAKTTERKVLMEAIAFCLDRKNHIGVFLVWKVDRLARNTEDHFALRKLLQDAGVELRSVTEPIGNEPSAKLFEVMIAGFAEFDNSIRRLRAVNGMRARIRDGIWPFMAPLGYRNRSLARRDTKKTDPDPIDPLVFPLLQRLLKGLASGVYTQTDMVRELEAANFQTLTRTKPTLQFVDHLLTKQLPFYAGLLRDAFGDEVEYHRGRHEPMITEDEMRAIQAMKSGGVRARIKHQRTNPTFPLRRLVLCFACGRALTGSSPKGSHAHYAYYHCFNRTCPLRYKNIPKDELEGWFRELLAELAPRTEFLQVLAEAVAKYGEEQQEAGQASRQAQEAALSALEGRRTKIFEMAESGVYDAPQAKERLAAIEREIGSANLMLAHAIDETFYPASALDNARKAIERLMTNWFDLEPPVRASFQKIIFPEGISYARNSGFGTAKVGRIFELNRSFGRSSSEVVHHIRTHWNEVLQELKDLSDLASQII